VIDWVLGIPAEFLLLVPIYFGIMTLGVSWEYGWRWRLVGSLVFALSLCPLLLPRFLHSTVLITVVAVNPNRGEPLSFSVGESLGIHQDSREGLLDPYQFAGRTSDGRIEVFENQNSILWWKFDRQALQMDLQAAKTYQLLVSDVWGMRNAIRIECEMSAPDP